MDTRPAHLPRHSLDAIAEHLDIDLPAPGTTEDLVLTGISQNTAQVRTGDLFVAMPGARREHAFARAEAILAHCRNTTVPTDDGRAIRFTLSAGVCEAEPGQAIDDALAKADAAMYAAKREGRDRAMASMPAHDRA